MVKSIVRSFSFVFILLFAIHAPAQNLRDPQFVKRAQAGFDEIFNLDYDQARQVFASLEREYPQHPAPPLYRAAIFWLEEMLRRQDLSLNRFTAPAYFSWKTEQAMPAPERAGFFEALQKSDSLSRSILQRNPGDKDARYFLAMTYGLRSSFAITIDHSLHESFTNGNKAYSYARQLIEEDPHYYDAYLTAGIYEYIVGSIPWYLKWMVLVIGAHGTKEKGFEDLKLASEKGQYVKNEAELVSMVFYVREHMYPQALQLARDLMARYPRSFLFPLNIAQILQMSGQKEQAVAMLLDVEKRAAAREPNYQKLAIQTLEFNLGNELMQMGRLDAAQEQFRKCISDPKTASRERVLAHLNLGRILGSEGLRNEAMSEFRTVLALEDIDNSHSEAKHLLKKIEHS